MGGSVEPVFDCIRVRGCAISGWDLGIHVALTQWFHPPAMSNVVRILDKMHLSGRGGKRRRTPSRRGLRSGGMWEYLRRRWGGARRTGEILCQGRGQGASALLQRLKFPPSKLIPTWLWLGELFLTHLTFRSRADVVKWLPSISRCNCFFKSLEFASQVALTRSLQPSVFHGSIESSSLCIHSPHHFWPHLRSKGLEE